MIRDTILFDSNQPDYQGRYVYVHADAI